MSIGSLISTSVLKNGHFAITFDYKLCKFVPLSRSDALPFGCGGNPFFDWAKPAHSPSLNVLGAVCGTGQKLPLHFLDGAFNQWRYHDWLTQQAVPWLQANWPGGLNNPRCQLRYQHDGHRSHTTGRVRKLAIILKFTCFYTEKSHSTDHQVSWRGLRRAPVESPFTQDPRRPQPPPPDPPSPSPLAQGDGISSI